MDCVTEELLVRSPIEELLARLDAIMAETSAVAFDGLSDDDTVTLTLGLCNTADRVTALVARALASGQTRMVNARQGHRTMENVVAAELPVSASKLRFTRRVGTWIIDFPILADAYCSGALTTAQVHVLHEAHNARVHHAMVDFQEDFIRHGQDLTFPEFKQAVANWLLISDPDGPTPNERELADRYGVKIDELPNGDVKIVALLDPVAGKAATKAVEHAATALHRAHADNCPHAERIPWRTLRMNGLMMLLARGYARSDGTVGTPLVNLVISQRLLEWLTAQLVSHSRDAPNIGADPLDQLDLVSSIDPWNRKSPDGRSETIDGMPLHPSDMLRALAIADLRVNITDAAGNIQQVAKDRRLFPEWAANASRLNSRGLCSIAGCDAPTHWLQTDHVHPKSLDGVTALENAQTLCAPHNQWKSDRVDCGY